MADGHTSGTTGIVVFVSYAHADNQGSHPSTRWLDRLRTHLRPLEFQDVIAIASDRDVDLGDDWHAHIQASLERAGAAVLLVSPAFLASHYIRTAELPVLLRRAQEQGLKIIPVILRPCLFAETRFAYPDPQHGPDDFTLASLQAAGAPSRALNEMTEGEQDRALLAVAQTLLRYATERERPARFQASGQAPRIDLTHLPAGAEHFLGRQEELAELDAAWDDGGCTQVVELFAAGGVGKTALVKRWLDRMKADGWRGASRVFGWSFYSQGTSDDRQASEDGFLAAALEWFHVPHDPALNPWDKGRLLAEEFRRTRTLLVLDGLEPLQYPPGPLAGELRAPGLKALLGHLTSAGQPGLCVLTSRAVVRDLAEHERDRDHPDGGVVRRHLGNLSEADSARLLHHHGVRRAGAAAIGPEDEELRQASREVHGHALTLSLLGSYLTLAYGGDVRQRDQVDFAEADAQVQGGHAFKVMAAYERWFAREGDDGARELAALRLLGFFDRPATPESLAVLRAAPVIPDLTEPLLHLTPATWRATLTRLQECGLILPVAEDGALDAHPLVREYLAATLRERQPEAWRKGHRRIYEQLKATVPYRPDDLAGLQPLYQAVAHGCLAGLQREACDGVYVDRILRGTRSDGFYSSRSLGAFGANLGALAGFFEGSWLSPSQSGVDQAWLMAEAAHCLRALGRLEEALELKLRAAETRARSGDWKNAAINYGNVSEVHLLLGYVTAALADARRSLQHAERSKDPVQLVLRRATLGDALHQHGEHEAAGSAFVGAETAQASVRPEHPLLYSLQGFLHCDLLLAPAEREAARVVEHRKTDSETGLDRCRAVQHRAARTLRLQEGMRHAPLLDFALSHLTLGRCAFYESELRGDSPDAASAIIKRAVEGLREAGAQEYIVRGLLTRAWLRHSLGDALGAAADLDEAWQIASRGGMRLFMADVQLYRARLFHDRGALAKARTLIEQCEYFRRLPELEDAEAALGVDPAPS